MIDQSAVIEQLVAENALLRDALRHSPDKEIQIAAALSMVVDELTRLGPYATARVLEWVFCRYGISASVLPNNIRDRRPKEKDGQSAAHPAEPPPVLERRGALLRQARVAAGLTQKALSGLSGVPQVRISQIEIGNTQPSEGVWERLETAIGETR